MKYQKISIEKVGLNIRLARTKMGISMEDLAVKCGVSYPTISKIELAKSDISLVTLDKLAKALNVSIEDLLNMEE